MDYQNAVDVIAEMACVISVELNEDGSGESYLVVAGNKGYIDSIEHPPAEMHQPPKHFVPFTSYTEYVPRDLNFEQYCYRAAVEGRCLHAYVHPENFDFWFNMTILPVETEEENKHYCMYIMQLDPYADVSQMVDVSKNLAQTVLEICIKIRGTMDFRAAMNDVIRDIRDICEARRCCIILMDPPTRTCNVLCEALEEGNPLPPIASVLRPSFYDLMESWEETIGGSSGLIICNEQDMELIRERNPAWHESLVEGGVRSMILFPVKYQDELLGYIWATNFDEKKAQDIKETLELATMILGSEIAGYQMMERLQILSNKDMLTGVQNRNRMNYYVERFSAGEMERGRAVGAVFTDLNDLKSVNDNIGHEAGDRLLRSAAAALRKVFPEEWIFRAGGDEFTAILLDITPEELAAKVEQLREAAVQYEDVSFAIGFDVQPDTKDVRTALRNADERMYEDKRKFYEQHPERRRKPGRGSDT